MKLGIHVQPSTPFKDILKIVNNGGFKAVEIMLHSLELSSNFKEKFKHLVKDYDLELLVHAPFINIDLASINPFQRKNSKKKIIKSVEVAKNLGASILTVHPSHIHNLSLLMYVQRSLLIKNLRKIADFADQKGVVIGLENMPKLSYQIIDFPGSEQSIAICSDLEEFSFIVQSVDKENFGVTFDVGHAFTVGDPLDFLKTLKDYIVNIHLSDSKKFVHKHLPLGEGEINLKPILQTLKKYRYKGPLVMELEKLEDQLNAKRKVEKILEESF
ncbi:MAG: hypothetical protein B6U77_00185 [Candidatus Hecatellales archaeon ex4484_218]|nr:MAG: hypothetical protein B6U77_00185 [Candidatus Hecatellales archaeon ex4484_218]